MKKHLAALIVLLTSNALLAQTNPDNTEKKSNKFEILVIPKLGFGVVEETGSAPTNGNINGADFLLSMKLGQSFNLSSGMGYFEFWGNRTVAGNTAFIRNGYLHFPLTGYGDVLIYKNKTENQSIFFTAGLGVYGNHQLKQYIETITGIYKSSNLGWNMGWSGQLGVKFDVSDILNLGVGYESQVDLTEMKKDGVERSVANASTINFTLGFKL